MSVKVREGYKQTEVGILPEDWRCRKLSELIEANRAIRYGVVQPGKFDRSGVYMLRSQDYSKGWANEQNFFKISPTLADQFKNARLRADDIVMTVVGAGVGQVVQIPQILEGGVLSRSTARIAVDNCAADSSFVKYCLISSLGKAQIPNFLKEGAQPVLSCNDLGKFPIPQPHIKEQRAIATALSDMDALISGLDQLIAKKRDIKQATMQQLLTGQTRLPGFSGEWGKLRLETICAFITKGSTPTTYGFGWESSGILFLRSECVAEQGLDLSQSMFISDAAHNTLRRSEICGGDLLITITGNVGRVILLSDGFPTANINQHIARIRVISPEVDSRFVYHFLSVPDVRKKYNSITTGQAYPQISLKQVRETEIRLPALAEQVAIAQILSDMDTELATLESRRDKAKQLKQGMMQELLTGRIRFHHE